MNLEKAITQEVAKMLTVGFEYQTEYGTRTKEAALTPHVQAWLSSNKEEIIEEVIKQIGKEKIVNDAVDALVKQINNNGYWDSFRWKELAQLTAPLIADKVASRMYEEHKKEICK